MARTKKPKVCSGCRSRRIAKIECGLPHFTEEERQQVEAGKIVLGGCVVSDSDPDWQCVVCGKLFPERKESSGLPIGDCRLPIEKHPKRRQAGALQRDLRLTIDDWRLPTE